MNRNEMRLMQKPWITPEILSKCKERDCLLKEISREHDQTKIDTLRSQYKALRNQITKEKRESKKAHFSAYFENNRKKSSEIWRGIRSLVNVKKSKSSNIKLQDSDGNLITDPKKIADMFNDHFATVGHKVQQKIPVEKGSFLDYMNKRDKNGKVIINPEGKGFFLTPTDSVEISSILFFINSSKSLGPNSIPVFLLKSFNVFYHTGFPN